MNKSKSKYPQNIKKDVFLIWKKLGETPLQALERLRKQEGIKADVKMTYAGRLDPLAEGELLILTGQECKQKQHYLNADKEYEVEILLGAKTDTGDVMGVITDSDDPLIKSHVGFNERLFDDLDLDKILKKFIGKVSWPYPIFSSKTVEGKPLFLWSLEGKIDEVKIPTRESEIYELELLSRPTAQSAKFTQLSVSELRNVVHMKINSLPKASENIVKGKDTKRLGADFRRAEVLQSWAKFFECPERRSGHAFEIIKIRCKCSSGTYMRTLAQEIGKELGTDALAISIVRTKIFYIL